MSAPRFTRLLEYGFVLFLIALLASIIVPTVGRTCGRPGPSRLTDFVHLRDIGNATAIYAYNHNDRFPEATDIWDYARILAEVGTPNEPEGLNDARFWRSKVDPASAPISSKDPKFPILLPSKNGQPRALNPAFRSIKPAFAIPVGRRLSTNHPATTPIAWTRGLQSDGTWAKHSPYGGQGGYILFLGGNVAYYLNLTDDGGQLIARDGSKTANILEALPVGCRISEYVPTPEEQTTWSAQAPAQPHPTHNAPRRSGTTESFRPPPNSPVATSASE